MNQIYFLTMEKLSKPKTFYKAEKDINTHKSKISLS